MTSARSSIFTDGFRRWLAIGLLAWMVVGTLPLRAWAEPSASYVVGPGDRLKIDVWQEEDLSGLYSVSKEGLLIINWVEPVKVTGLTLDQARLAILGTLKKYIKDPVVTLSVAEYASQRVTVLGEVKFPGQVFLKSENSVLDVILKDAGGVTESAGDTLQILRPKPGGTADQVETTSLNLKQLLQGDRSQNLRLKQGDTIIVSRFNASSGASNYSTDSVFVLGEVTKSGTFKINSSSTALSVILEAGGFTKFASPNRVKLVRNNGKEKKEFILRMKDVMTQGDKSKDMALAPGDIIIVPRSIL